MQRCKSYTVHFLQYCLQQMIEVLMGSFYIREDNISLYVRYY